MVIKKTKHISLRFFIFVLIDDITIITKTAYIRILNDQIAVVKQLKQIVINSFNTTLI